MGLIYVIENLDGLVHEMKREALRRVDFAALDTLRQVFRLRSFSAAADAMGLKQSSVSYTIGRLRTAFDDPLFVRQGNAISPTERCIEIVAAAEDMLERFEHLALPAAFDPAQTRASVTLSATYLARLVLIPGLIQELRAEAPGISVEMVPGDDDVSAQLLSGRADLALSPVDITASGVLGTRLFDEPYVCLVSEGSALAKAEMTLARYTAAAHLVINYGQTWTPPVSTHLKAQDMALQVAVSTPNPEDVRHILPGTDLIATMPRRIAQQFREGVVLRPCPIAASARLTLYWPARLQASPLHQWLRAKLERLAGAG